jgi:hypothetical protein
MGITYMFRFTNTHTVLSTSFTYDKNFNTSKIDLKFVWQNNYIAYLIIIST